MIRRSALERLRGKGVELPGPWVGLLDLGRMVEGLMEEPQPKQPLSVVGLDELLRVDAERVDGLMRRVRQSIHDGKGYFAWKEIPLVLLVHGRLEGLPGDEEGLKLHVGGEQVPLTPLVGRGLKPVGDDDAWWWAPQPG